MKRKTTKFILNTKPTIMQSGEQSQAFKAIILLSELAGGIIILRIMDIISI